MQDLKGFLKRINETILFYFFGCATFILLVYIALNSDGTSDSGDGITHYLISRFSFKHPLLFLDLWGKPVFTILSSPFSQFGLKGITIFNICCGMLSAYSAYRIAKLLELKFSWTVLFLILFAPIYFGVINSGLTEPLFSLLLIFCILQIMTGPYMLAAFLFSFGTFIRPEANFLIPVFIFYFILSKRYKAIPLLFAGTVIFTIIGYFHFYDVFWLKTQSPYAGYHADSANYVFEHGDLFSYIGNYERIIGFPGALLFVAGCLFLLAYPFTGNKINTDSTTSKFFREEFFLIYGCLFACIVVHTFVWWKGIFPTLGLLRYMSSIIPLVAILSLRGMNSIFLFIKNILLQYVIVLALVSWVIYLPFHEYYYPFNLGDEERVIKESSDWLLQSPFKKNKVLVSHPYSILTLDIDPYDQTDTTSIKYMRVEHLAERVKSKSIIVWDAHYGAHDNNLPAKSFLESSEYTLLKKFEPKTPFTVFGDTPFEVYIFQRN